MDVGGEYLLLAFFAVGPGEHAFILERIRVPRPQAHVAGEDAVAVRVVERLEVVPLLDRHGRERREHVIRERDLAGALLDLELYVPRRAPRRLMRDRGVQGVELVLEEDLPVRVLDHAEAVRNDLDLAFGRAVADVVESDLRAPEKLDQPRAFGGEAREHEAAVVLHPRRALHVAVGIVAGPARAGVAGL